MSNKKSFSSFLLELELDDYVVIDLETTGLNPKMDCITEISAYRFINGKPKDDFSTLKTLNRSFSYSCLLYTSDAADE